MLCELIGLGRTLRLRPALAGWCVTLGLDGDLAYVLADRVLVRACRRRSARRCARARTACARPARRNDPHFRSSEAAWQRGGEAARRRGGDQELPCTRQ